MTSNKIVPLEKKIFILAFIFCCVLLVFIALASFKYGISLPGCVKDVEPFTTGSFKKTSELHYELHSVAKMWSFDPASISVPKGATLDIFLSSVDVNHGFHIPGTNVNLMAVPGVVNYARVTFDKEGDYSILCHEYCGLAHQTMHAVIHVGGDEESQPMLSAEHKDEAAQTASVDPNADPLAEAKKLYQEKICFSCHSLNGDPLVGPTFKGLYGSKVILKDGTEVIADDDYLAESIKEPTKKIVKGYENVPMPPLPITDDEIKKLIELIKSIR